MKNRLILLAAFALALAVSGGAKETKKAGASKPTKKTCIAACKTTKHADFEACSAKAGKSKPTCKKNARAAYTKCAEACLTK